MARQASVPKQIGFVGLGSLGCPIARRLVQSGYDLVVHDIDPAAIDRFTPAIGHAADGAASLHRVAERAEVVFLCLPTLPAIRKVVLGLAGLASGAGPKIVVDLSTTGASFARDMAAAAAERNVAFLDAPVSGGIARASAGTLTIMCSGPRPTYDAVEPILTAIGQHLYFMGERPGHAQTMKLINNTLLMSALTVSFEAMVFGVKSGLDPDQMIEILNTGTGRNYATEHKIPEDILTRRFASGGSAALTEKDLRLYLEEARELGAPMWATSGMQELWSYVIAQGGGAQDNTAMIKYLEAWAGVQVRGNAAGPCQTPASI